ncbi:MAG TPA: YHS domain-containing (seleno)protein [Burkholderiales bacterium]|nr:YHS domain-containing (seleno)protein [Burkholderiales bacterium]
MNAMIRVLGVTAALALPASALSQDRAPALKGHDPVAYFVDGKPVKGTASLVYEFDDSRYYFSKVKHRELFAANPERYVPQFSGLCTAGLAKGMRAEANPGVWKIVDGKLYIFSSVSAREAVDKDPSLLAKAHQNFKASN